jgi:hypothetical protein
VAAASGVVPRTLQRCQCVCSLCADCVLLQVRGRLTVQEGRNVQYKGITHAAATILREVRV